MVNIGLIGAGYMGKTHARAYRKCPHACLKRVVDQDWRRAAALADESDAQAGLGYEAVLDDPDIHLVDICLPTPLHPGFAIRALQAGKHVVVEKPLALSLPAVDAILAANKASGKFLMVAHVLRFWPEYLAIRKVLLSGRLGEPLQAAAYRLTNLPRWAAWFADPQVSGGAVLDLQVHDLDIFNWFFGPPISVFARGTRSQSGGWDHVTTQVSYASVNATAEASFMMPRDFPFTAGLRILCERGALEYNFRAGGESFEVGKPLLYLYLHEPSKPNQPVIYESCDAFENEMAYFVDCVQNNEPPAMVTPAEARMAVQTCLAARQSLETGQVIQIMAG